MRNLHTVLAVPDDSKKSHHGAAARASFLQVPGPRGSFATDAPPPDHARASRVCAQRMCSHMRVCQQWATIYFPLSEVCDRTTLRAKSRSVTHDLKL